MHTPVPIDQPQVPDPVSGTDHFLAQVIETVAEGFAIIDATWRLTYLNRFAESLLRRSRAELVGRSIWETFAEAVGTRFDYEFRRAVEDRVAVVFVEYFPPLTGWFELRVYPMPQGGISLYFRDVTQRIEAEKALKVAKEEAEQANRAKNEFLSRISHELRTPLNSIIGFGTLLSGEVTRPRNQEYCAQIVSAGRQLLKLINEILDFARIEAGEVSLSLEPVSASALVQHVLSRVETRAAPRNVTVNASAVLHSPAIVWGDFQRLTQVMTHLLANAVHYSRPGTAVVVTCDSISPQRVRLCVTNPGQMLPPDQLKRLWVPFDVLQDEVHRVNAALSAIASVADAAAEAAFPGDVSAGSVVDDATDAPYAPPTQSAPLPDDHNGIGLALARGLMRRMGGDIGCESVPEKGTTFWVELAAYAAVAPPYVTFGHETMPVTGPTKQCTVLYVEDNFSNYRLIERIFEQRPNITLYTAAEGAAALNLAQRYRPDLLLLDMHLPDMRGDELLQLLRDRGLGDVPVVVVSADATGSQARRMAGLGVSAYLTKPIDVLEFLSVIDAALDKKSTATGDKDFLDAVQ